MERKTWGLWALTAIVVGNMVGTGIMMLPATLAQKASPMGTTLAWLVTAIGVLFIALVFGNLAVRKPELTAGPQSHAVAIFKDPNKGRTAGFSIVWGYWVANWASNTAIITSFAGYLSTFVPVMKDDKVLMQIGSFSLEQGKFLTFVICTAILWFAHYILVNKHSHAGNISLFATATKVIGFLLFIIAALFAFDPSNFGDFNSTILDDKGNKISLFGQVDAALISTLWAFVGIESAILLSGRAKKSTDIKKATILGLGIATSIYLLISLLTMGALPVEALKKSDKPLVDALTSVIGNSGGTIMAIVALLALAGSIIGWILVSAEVAYQGSKSKIFFKWFGDTNKNNSPSRALLITNIMSQIFMFSVIFDSISNAYAFLITVGTLAYLIPYLVSPLYQLVLVFRGETYDNKDNIRIKDGIIASLALLYSLYVIKSGTGDLKTFSLGIGLFLSGFIFYPLMRKEFNDSKGRKVS
jgi:arginine:ornithine antiporter/lysine permease